MTALRHRIICTGILLSVLYWTIYPVVAQERPEEGFLTVTSDPAGLSVYINEALVGVTPLENHRLSVGSHTVRIIHPNRSEWNVKDWVQDVTILAGETTRAQAKFVGTVTIISTPFDAAVYINGTRIGTTPLHLPNLTSGIHTLSIRKEGYEDTSRSVIVSDTTRQTLNITLVSSGQKIAPVRLLRGRTNQQPLKKKLGFATLGAGVTFSLLALMTHRRANRAYDNYQGTGDPVALEDFFQQAERNDRLTGIFIGVAQVNFIASAYLFVSRMFGKNDQPSVTE